MTGKGQLSLLFACVYMVLAVDLLGQMRGAVRADDKRDVAPLVKAVQALSSDVYPASERERLASMVRDDQSRRLREANRRGSQAWEAIKTREDWERFRAARIAAIRSSLGQFAKPSRTPRIHFTGKVRGDGFWIHNIVFESNPPALSDPNAQRGANGTLWVTANLYSPIDLTEDQNRQRPSTPGILICHSHHTAKTHGELQDMGMTWARAGCLVLVMDQLGHGERRQHPFRTEADYLKPFRVGRQDYYFRYDISLQLHLVGESLIGWMAYDLVRGVDVLLSQGCDPKRIILLGAVAGGGDPAAVAAALDERITAAVPFNFGGPQPETRYPLPEDAETSFNYAGGGSWESTRNLRRSAADGFLPWVIVGSIAPRRLVYAHEFSWDRPRDPVWKRLQTIYGFYDAADHLAYTHGRGELRGQPPAATHCTHIGREHRKMIHDAFRRWFDIKASDKDEYSARREPRELLCMTPDLERELKPTKLHEILGPLADERLAAARKTLNEKPAAEQREHLRASWTRLLGNVEPQGKPTVHHRGGMEKLPGGATLERLSLEVEPGIVVPMVLVLPGAAGKRPVPVVVGVAQSGKEGFWKHRAELLASGLAVCLPDLRGTGETRSGSERGRTSGDTSRSSTELMLGRTMLGARLRDLRSVLAYLRDREEIDGKRMALWGDSFAPTNPPTTQFAVPHDAEGRLKQSEPLGALLALLGALYEEDVRCVYGHGGLARFRSILDSPFVYVPHDMVVPGMLGVCDVPDLAAALGASRVRLDGDVDGLNRPVTSEQREAATVWLKKHLRP